MTISCQFITLQQMERLLPKQEYWYWQKVVLEFELKYFWYLLLYN